MKLIGVSKTMVRKWALSVRLTAYRNDDRPKSPYLFTREDCLSALQAVPVEPRRQIKNVFNSEWVDYVRKSSKVIDAALENLLKTRTKRKSAE